MEAREGAEAPDPRVDDRVLRVLTENPGRIAFNGLRRALGVHPESLTRALRRLEREGAITRSSNGYALGATTPGGRVPPVPIEVGRVATVALPLDRPVDDLFGRLSGRWWGHLRWVGVFDHPGDPWLVWAVDGTSAHVMLRSRERSLEVVTDLFGGPDAPRVRDAAYDLLGHAVASVRALPAPMPVHAELRALGERDPSRSVAS